ncbi:MAG: amidohydrolase family protein [bacterium]|nr:amidohydrolase family protein [bacterium]
MILGADHLISMTTPPFRDGAVAIGDGRILAVGQRDRVSRDFPHLPLRYLDGCVLMPGLVNAHTHLELTKLRDGKPGAGDFISWVLSLMAARSRMTDHDYENTALDGAAQSLAAGTTCLGEISTTSWGERAMNRRGLRGIVFLEVLGRGGAETGVWMEQVARRVNTTRDQTRPPVFIGLSPHSPYTLSEERLGALAAYLEVEALPYAIHVAESPMELDYFLYHKGAIRSRLFPAVGWEDMPVPVEKTTPLLHIAKHGLLTERLLLIHGVHLSDADMDLVHQAGAKVVLCPRSNHYLGVGLPRIAALRERGITIALGTDSLASSPSLSLWDEMRFMQELFGDAGLLSPASLLRMATLGGAEALGLASTIGSLERGKAADLLAVATPAGSSHDLIKSLIAETGTDHVRLVMIDGQTMKDQTACR